MKYKKYVLFSLLFISLGLSLFSFNVNSQLPTINYSFHTNTFYPYNNSISYDSSFNMRKSQEYTQDYEATDSFENDVGLIGLEIPFVDQDFYTISEVISSYTNHDSVLKLESSGSGAKIQHDFTEPLTDTFYIEYWVNCFIDDDVYFLVENENSQSICSVRYMSLTQIRSYYGNGVGGSTYVITTVEANSWNHIKCKINATSDKISVWINQQLVVDNENCPTDYTLAYSPAVEYYSAGAFGLYIDAFGIYPKYDYESEYTYDFNELTTDTEFSTVDIYENWTYNKASQTIIMIDNDGVSQECLDFIDSKNNGYPSLAIPILTTNDYVSMYLKSNNTYELTYCFFQDGNNDKFQFGFYQDYFYVTDSFTLEVAIIDNTWYKVECEYDIDTDTYDIWFDNVYIDNYAFDTTATEINQLTIRTDLSDYDYDFCLDNLQMDARTLNYSIGSNIFPSIQYYDTYEVDKDEFALGTPNQLYAIDSEVAGYWYQGGCAGLGTSDIQADISDSNDRIWQITTEHGGYSTYTFRNTDGFYSTNKFIEIELDCSFGNMSTSLGYGYYTMYIHSSDEYDTAHLLWWINGTMAYYNGSHYLELMTDLVQDWNYTFNLRINYEVQSCFLDVYNNDIYNNSFVYPIYPSGKTGISAIYFLVYDNNHALDWKMDSVGVYANKVSLATELGYNTFDLYNDNDLSLQTYNNLHIKASGNFSISACNGSFSTIGQTIRTFRQNSFNIYSDTLLHINNYLYHIANVTNPTIVLWINGSNYKLSSFQIDGIRLYDNYNDIYYEMSFISDYIDDNHGYFYVDNVNKLNWYIYTNDGYNEYMKASFDITNVDTNNYSLGFTGNIDYSTIYGYLYANYTTVNQQFTIQTYISERYYVLTENYTLSEFNLLITDNDNDYSGITNGYIYGLTLFPVYDISYDIVFTTIIAMIIPLIIILVPSLAITVKYKKAFTICFLLFSVVCYFINFIPIWLLGVIIFATLSSFLNDSESDLS